MALRQTTHNNLNSIVYCVNDKEGYIEMLVNSIQSIRRFNETIPIKVLSPCKLKKELFSGLSVGLLSPVAIFNKFPADKCIAGQVDCRNILLLDVDTFILKDIEPIFNLSGADIFARLSYRYSTNWEEKYDRIWKSNNAKLGIGKADIINSGVVLFKNNAHKKLYDTWVDTIKKFYDGEIDEVYSGEWMFEQISLSMSIAKLGLKLSILDKKFHVFGWDKTEFEKKDAVVIHTNCSKYKELKNKLNKQKRI